MSEVGRVGDMAPVDGVAAADDMAPADGAPPVGGQSPDAPEMGLEARLARIEEIARTLDSDSLGLDEALALFEEGVGHVRRAKERLAAAELKVEELTGTGDEVP